MLCRVQIFRPSQPRKLLAQTRQGQTHNIEIAAFDPRNVTLRGDPRCGELEVCARTKDYEYLLGHTRFTLYDVVAINAM